MKRKNPEKIEKKIEQTLKVLDELPRAEPKPFFYTRLQARMQGQAEETVRWRMRPAFIWSGLVVIILLNIGMVVTYSTKGGYSKNEQSAGAFAEEYGLTIEGIDSN